MKVQFWQSEWRVHVQLEHTMQSFLVSRLEFHHPIGFHQSSYQISPRIGSYDGSGFYLRNKKSHHNIFPENHTLIN